MKRKFDIKQVHHEHLWKMEKGTARVQLLTTALLWTWQRQYLHNSATLRLQLTELFATSLHFSSFSSVIESLPLTRGDSAM